MAKTYSAIVQLYGLKVYQGQLKEKDVPDYYTKDVKAYVKELKSLEDSKPAVKETCC